MHRYPTSRPVRDSSFGPRLAALRKARRLTQVQLAEATKTTQRSISYYENDDGVPPSSIVSVMAQAPTSPDDELFGLKPSPMAPPVTLDDDPETHQLWKRFQMVTQLPEKDERAVIRQIHSLAAVATRKNGSQEDHDGR